MVVRTEILSEIIPFVAKDVVKVITGIRRCGKSTLLEQIKDRIIKEIDPGAPYFYVNLDDEANGEYLKNDRDWSCVFV